VLHNVHIYVWLVFVKLFLTTEQAPQPQPYEKSSADPEHKERNRVHDEALPKMDHTFPRSGFPYIVQSVRILHGVEYVDTNQAIDQVLH